MEKIPHLNWALARVICDLRQARGLTQGQLAGFAGLSEPYITGLECGRRGDSINALIQIASVFNMNASEILHLVEKNLQENPRPPEGKKGRPQKKG